MAQKTGSMCSWSAAAVAAELQMETHITEAPVVAVDMFLPKKMFPSLPAQAIQSLSAQVAVLQVLPTEVLVAKLAHLVILPAADPVAEPEMLTQVVLAVQAAAVAQDIVQAAQAVLMVQPGQRLPVLKNAAQAVPVLVVQPENSETPMVDYTAVAVAAVQVIVLVLYPVAALAAVVLVDRQQPIRQTERQILAAVVEALVVVVITHPVQLEDQVSLSSETRGDRNGEKYGICGKWRRD